MSQRRRHAEAQASPLPMHERTSDPRGFQEVEAESEHMEVAERHRDAPFK